MKLIIIDSYKAWTVTIGSTIVNSIVCGLIKVYSMVIVQYQELLNAPMSLLMLSASIINSLIGLSALLSTYLSEKYTAWKTGLVGAFLSTVALLIMAFAYHISTVLVASLILGFAFSLLFVPSISAPGKCHIKHQSLSQSIIVAGASVGGILMALGMSLFINVYSFRGVMVMIAGFVFHSAIGSVLMPTHIIEMKDGYKPVLVFVQGNMKMSADSMIKIGKWTVSYYKSSKNSKWIWPPRRLWRTIILYSFGMANVMNGYVSLNNLYGAFARSLDISVVDAAFYLMIQSIFDCIGRLIVGYVVDLKLIPRWIWYCINGMLLCLVSVLVGIFPTMTLFYIYLFCTAVFGPFMMVLPVLILIESVGIEFTQISFSIYLFIQGGMALFVFYAIGYFCDITGMYNYAVLISGLKIGLGASLILIDRCIEFL